MILAFLLMAGCPTAQHLDTSSQYIVCEEGAVGLIVDDGTLTGQVPLTLTLGHPEVQQASVTLSWSSDNGETWQTPTVSGLLDPFPTSVHGQAYPLVWDTVTDLGRERVEGISFKAVAASECGVWPLARLEGLVVDNTSLPTACDVDLIHDMETADGPVTLPFLVSHPTESQVEVALAWSTDGRVSWQEATVRIEDCDGDGQREGTGTVATTPKPSQECLTWDSEEDFRTDAEVILRLSCSRGDTLEDEALSSFLRLENDPLPDPGELVVTELHPAASLEQGSYLEIHNLTHHVLNLQGLEFSQVQGGDTTGFLLADLAGTLPLGAQGYLVIGSTTDAALNGCLPVDATWGAFVLGTEGTLAIHDTEQVLAFLDFRSSQGWSFDLGYARVLAPGAYGASDWADIRNWCFANDIIPACAEAAPTDRGNPGGPDPDCGK